jgi:SOS-response transcriptional repressor LexA
MAENIRPTKKQRQLLEFIDSFINEHNYSPSYREIMSGLNYTSVATVALHVNNLVKRGHLVRREGKARSLEVARGALGMPPPETDDDGSQSHEDWLIEQAHNHMTAAENAEAVQPDMLADIETLLETLTILDVDSAEHDFSTRLDALRAL